MRALTLWRPWDEPVGDGSKPVENRGWPPPGFILGEHIAIHAGKHYQAEAVRFIRDRGYRVMSRSESDNFRAGHVVSVVRVAGYRDTRDGKINMKYMGDPAQLPRVLAMHEEPYWIGPVGWWFDEATPIQPVACGGHQGLWTLPEDVATKVRARWDVARRRVNEVRRG